MGETVKEKLQARYRKTEPLVVGNKLYSSSTDYNLTEKEMEKARTELGETEEKKRECLQELKNKLSREGNYRTDDDFLMCFIRVRKFDCKKAYHNVKEFYEKRNKYFDYFGIPSVIKTYKNLKFATILPYTDEEGSILIWLDPDLVDVDVMSFDEMVQPLSCISDVILTNPKLQVNGIVGIVDVKGVGRRHLTEGLKKNRIMRLTQLVNTCPCRFKKLIAFNTNAVTRFVFNLVRPVLSKKVADRVLFLGSKLNELHQHVDPAILPKKLGGMLEDDFCLRPELILDNIQYLEYDRSFTGLT